MPYLSMLAGHYMQLLLEAEYIKLDDIMDEIRAMGNDRNHPSGQGVGVRSKHVLLQTIEEILKFVEGKPIEKVGCKGSCCILIALVVPGIGIHEMWAVSKRGGSRVRCLGGD